MPLTGVAIFCFWIKLGEMLQSYASVGAVLFGGYWAWRGFVRERIKFPRFDCVLKCTPVPIESGYMLRAEVALTNTGKVLAKPKTAELRLRQVVPLPESVLSAVGDGYDPVDEGESQIELPCLAQRTWDGEKLGLEIEPGECCSLYADFFVPRSVRVVELYFHLANPTKAKRGIGWSVTSIKYLDSPVEAEVSEEGRPILDEQERKQKAQKPAQVKQPRPPETGANDRDKSGDRGGK